MLSSTKYSPQMNLLAYGISEATAHEASLLFLNNGNRKIFLGHNIFEEIFVDSHESVKLPYERLASVHIDGQCRLLVGPSYKEENMILTPYSGVRVDFESNIEVICDREVSLLTPIFSIPAADANVLLKEIGSDLRISDQEMVLFSLFVSTKYVPPVQALDDNRVSYDRVCVATTPQIVSVGKYISDATDYYLLSYPMSEIVHELCDSIDCSQVDTTLGSDMTYSRKNDLWFSNSVSYRPHYRLLQPLKPIKSQYQWAAVSPSFLVGEEVVLSYGKTWVVFEIKRIVDYPALTGEEDVKQFRWLHYAKVPFKLVYGYVVDVILPSSSYRYARSPCIYDSSYVGGSLLEVASTSTTTEIPMSGVVGWSPRHQRKCLSDYFPYENFSNSSTYKEIVYGNQYVVGCYTPCLLKVSPLDFEITLEEKLDNNGIMVYSIVAGTSSTIISPYCYSQGKAYSLSEFYYLTKLAQSLLIFEGKTTVLMSYKVTHRQAEMYHAVLWKYGIYSYFKLAMMAKYGKKKKHSRQCAIFPSYKSLRSNEIEFSGFDVEHVHDHQSYRSVSYDVINLTLRHSPVVIGTGSLNGREVWRVFASIASEIDYARWLVRLRYLKASLSFWNRKCLKGYSLSSIDKYIIHMYGWSVPSLLEDEDEWDDDSDDDAIDSDDIEFSIDIPIDDEELDRREDIM